MKKLLEYSEKLNSLRDLSLLFVRLILAYGFWGPGTKKLQNFGNIVSWFESIGIPFPTVNAFLATATEIAGTILLFIGLFTRFISLPLIIVMIVAIFSVHITNGFAAGNNGFEIPLYYIIMLLILIAFGSGKYSLDYLIKKK